MLCARSARGSVRVISKWGSRQPLIDGGKGGGGNKTVARNFQSGVTIVGKRGRGKRSQYKRKHGNNGVGGRGVIA